MITKITLTNYRAFRSFTFACNDSLNIVVGDNEAGKSTILEAIHLALTRKLNGRFVDSDISPYLFNSECVAEYVAAVQRGDNPPPPKVVVELCLKDTEPSIQHFRGTNNLDSADCIGIGVEVSFDDAYSDEYRALLDRTRSEFQTIPTEYYKVSWYTFAFGPLSPRSIPIRVSYIDATSIRLQTGTDYYLQGIISNDLDAKDRAGLAVAYRSLKEDFARQPALKDINDRLEAKRGLVTDKELSMNIDLSQRGSWETSLTPHLDKIPYAHVGTGEQHKLKIMLALDRRIDDAHIILMEEPENHLSFSSMSVLLDKIAERCQGKQIFVTTHSAYVLNKLGKV